ncbi:F-box domain-containing protein [Mycena indigotica]|uniref:F-box domain-containing protein n=1 Tax=Mycena indigotica TaxID=2126181 RepID=A0A8H6SMM4_9AGAR|nr:F-box domain-containing protein [Mycena indigotica]KAF7302181.1 F-box domain-containing protein [Mycena indigotica]
MDDVLPTEIVGEIFRLCIPIPTEGWDSEYQRRRARTIQAPLLLTQISQGWRRLALSIPVLWATFVVDLRVRRHHLPEFAEMWLTRAAEYPLDITIQGELVVLKQPQFDAVMTTLKAHTSHIRSLQLSLGLRDFVTLENLVRSWEFPGLEELGVTIENIEEEESDDEWDNLSWPVGSAFQSASSLWNLTIERLPLSTFHVATVQKLTRLHVCQDDFETALSAVSGLPNLLAFKLTEHETSRIVFQPEQPLVHSSIRRLDLAYSYKSGASVSFLRTVTLPSLRDLRLERTDHLGAPLDEFLARSSWPPLTTFHLTFVKPGNGLPPLFAALKTPSFASLEELVVALPDQDHLEIFCEQLGANNEFLPKLQRFVRCKPLDLSGTAAPPSDALSLIGRAVTSRLGREPAWPLRAVRIEWDEIEWEEDELVGLGLAEPSPTDSGEPSILELYELDSSVLEPFQLWKTKGMEVYLGPNYPTSASIV